LRDYLSDADDLIRLFTFQPIIPGPTGQPYLTCFIPQDKHLALVMAEGSPQEQDARLDYATALLKLRLRPVKGEDTTGCEQAVQEINGTLKTEQRKRNELCVVRHIQLERSEQRAEMISRSGSHYRSLTLFSLLYSSRGRGEPPSRVHDAPHGGFLPSRRICAG